MMWTQLDEHGRWRLLITKSSHAIILPCFCSFIVAASNMRAHWNQPVRLTSHQVRPPLTVRRRSKLLCFFFMMIVNYWYNETEFNLSKNFLLENDQNTNKNTCTQTITQRTHCIILYPHEDSILGHLQNAFECRETKNKLLFVLSDGIIMWGVADVDENHIDQWLLASDHPVTIFYNTTLIYTESQDVVCLRVILFVSYHSKILASSRLTYLLFVLSFFTVTEIRKVCVPWIPQLTESCLDDRLSIILEVWTPEPVPITSTLRIVE
jgi:hypothetical protein